MHGEARFPQGFLWGAATSAHQVEGGNTRNDWWRFERQPGKIANGDLSGPACRHYERFDEDFALAQADGHTAHRLSLEWSRLEPRRGEPDEGEVRHYHEVLAALRRRGLTPVVTLHHFTNPLWVADQGGWENPRTILDFEAFARFCGREYGAEVDWWVTVNEPEVLAFRAYSEGLWPPQKRDDTAALCAMSNLLEAHARAYRALHEEDRGDADGDGMPVRAGLAKNVVGLHGDRWWLPLDALRACFEDAVFNEGVLRCAATGTVDLSIPGARAVRRHVPGLAGSLDFLGLNYYTRWKVRMFAREPHVARRGVPLTDLGWEISPRGFEAAVRRAARLHVPLLVTENGFADSRDRIRPRALVEHLLHLHRTMAGGVPVLGYLHWSLLDNFEWADGYRGRFGLYQVDFADPERPRHRTRSADLYARICKANALPPEVLAEAGLAL
jgi:beta-glucosidase